AVKAAYAKAVSQVPELVLLTMSHLTSPFDTLRNEVLEATFPRVLNQMERPAAVATIAGIWATNPGIVVRALADRYAQDAGS
ncbi:hypothetical protein GUF49_07640, partial [Xanthomonas citri pv. citri]|nr:hypothetical protein [Xanthomonas citri pv. citri]